MYIKNSFLYILSYIFISYCDSLHDIADFSLVTAMFLPHTFFLQDRKGRHGVDQEDCPATSGELKDAFIFTAFEKQYSFTIIISICERSGTTLPTPSLLHTNGRRGCNPIQDMIVSSTETMSACHILCQSPDDTNLRIFAASAGMIPGREQ